MLISLIWTAYLLTIQSRLLIQVHSRLKILCLLRNGSFLFFPRFLFYLLREKPLYLTIKETYTLFLLISLDCFLSNYQCTLYCSGEDFPNRIYSPRSEWSFNVLNLQPHFIKMSIYRIQRSERKYHGFSTIYEYTQFGNQGSHSFLE